jgi:hypothetical protein
MKEIYINGEPIYLTDFEYELFEQDPEGFIRDNISITIEETEEDDEDTLCGIPYPLLFSDMFD